MNIKDFSDYLLDKYPILDLDLKVQNEYMDIVSITIYNEYQNLGIGTKILDEIKEYSKKCGLKSIILLSAPKAKGFYIKNGFICIKKPCLFEYRIK